MWKWIGLFLRNNNLLMGLTFSSKLDLDSYTISIAKSSSKKIGPLIRSVKFLSPWGLLCISINLPYSHAWNIVLLSCLGQCSWLLLVIFLLLFDCPMTNWATVTRAASLAPDVYHCIWLISTWKSPGALWQGWMPKPGQAPFGVWTGNLSSSEYDALTH